MIFLILFLAMTGGTREAAFLQAMHSASAIYKLAKTCSRGHPKCGCSSEIPVQMFYQSSTYRKHHAFLWFYYFYRTARQQI